MRGSRLNDWKTIPTVSRRYRASSSGSNSARLPSRTRIEAEVGRSSPAIMLNSVDLPDPELPKRARNSPFSTLRETASTARMTVSPSRYSRDTLSASMSIGAAGIVRLLNCITQRRRRSYAVILAPLKRIAKARSREAMCVGRPHPKKNGSQGQEGHLLLLLDVYGLQ